MEAIPCLEHVEAQQGGALDRLDEVLERFACTYGIVGPETSARTRVPGVSIFGATQPIPRRPLQYEPSIVILGQGSKTCYLNGTPLRYDAQSYLVLSVPVFLECESHASSDIPLRGISIAVDPARLRKLVSQIGDHLPLDTFGSAGSLPRGVEAAQLDARMADAATRLVECVRDPLESKALGEAIVNEIVFRVLLGPHGRALRMIAQQQTPYARVARSLVVIHEDFAQPLDVPSLARAAAMSPSAFHRAFKQVTGQSPIQYLKSVRLHRAHTLMTQLGVRVGTAASQVGYSSASQFSREFRRYFGTTPREARGPSSSENR